MLVRELASLPSRERGLKSYEVILSKLKGYVAPFAGAWIEIPLSSLYESLSWSLPSRERGLK